MRLTFKTVLFTASTLALLASPAAYADLGAVGSPVTPSSTQPAGDNAQRMPLPGNPKPAMPVVNNQSAAGQASDASGKPLIVIRFNQRHVYFQEPLKKVVNAVNDLHQPNLVYDVHSLVPQLDNELKHKREAPIADANLAGVLAELKRLGVPGSQVRVTPVVGANVTDQEIQIYVE